MGLFSGFNQITNAVNKFSSNVGRISSTVNSITSRASGIVNTVNSLSNINSIGDAARAIGQVGGAMNDFRALGSTFSRGFGSRTRMNSNFSQGIAPGAEPSRPFGATAVINERNSSAGGSVDPALNDWRVSLTIPTYISDSPIFSVFESTNNRVTFPYNPTILFGNSANYSTVHPVHTNFPYYAYENSQVQDITVAGEFFIENESDAAYWIGVLHFLRTMTKMFYGEGTLAGTPPLLTRLNGYGKHVLNNIPCVMSNFTVDLPQDVDYIQTTINNMPNYVPTQTQVTVTLLPQYSRLTQSKFDLKKFANGEFVTNDPNNTGFI